VWATLTCGVSSTKSTACGLFVASRVPILILRLEALRRLPRPLPDCPALLFDRIKGYPTGFRIFTNATTNLQRAALALGIDPTLRPLEALKAWMEVRGSLKLRKPVQVDHADFLENSDFGDAVDLSKFPVPHWHQNDGGPYIGSGSLVIMCDPDSGWVNGIDLPGSGAH